MPNGAFDAILKMAATAGPFGTVLMGTVAWLLWKQSQRKDNVILDLTKSGIRALTAVEASLNSIHRKLDGGRRRRR